MQAQARWAAHVLGVNDQRNPRVLLYGKLAEGKRQLGRPKLRFNDDLKAAFKSLEISVNMLEGLAYHGAARSAEVSSQLNSVAESRPKVNGQHGKREQPGSPSSAQSVKPVADDSAPRSDSSATGTDIKNFEKSVK